MTEAIRNPFLDEVVKVTLKANANGVFDLEFPTMANAFFTYKSWGGRSAGHGGCYGNTPGYMVERPNDWFYYPPPYNQNPHNGEKKLSEIVEYNHLAFLHPDSPFCKMVNGLDQFKGYETDDEKALVIARYGFAFSKNDRVRLTMPQIGNLLVFWKRAFMTMYVRPTFLRMMRDETHSKRPLAWNMLASTWWVTNNEDTLITLGFGDGHHMVSPNAYPHTVKNFINHRQAVTARDCDKWGEGALNRVFGANYRSKCAPSWEAPYYAVYDPKSHYINPAFTNFDGIVGWYWDNRVQPWL